MTTGKTTVRKEITITERKANTLLLKLIIPLTSTIFAIYYIKWADEQFTIDFFSRIVYGMDETEILLRTG